MGLRLLVSNVFFFCGVQAAVGMLVVVFKMNTRVCYGMHNDAYYLL